MQQGIQRAFASHRTMAMDDTPNRWCRVPAHTETSISRSRCKMKSGVQCNMGPPKSSGSSCVSFKRSSFFFWNSHNWNWMSCNSSSFTSPAKQPMTKLWSACIVGKAQMDPCLWPLIHPSNEWAAKDKFQTPYGAGPHRAKRWMIHYSFWDTRENDGIGQILNQLLGKETCFALTTLSALTKERNKFQHFSYPFHAVSSIFISLCSLYHLTTNIPELVKDFEFPYQRENSNSTAL